MYPTLPFAPEALCHFETDLFGERRAVGQTHVLAWPGLVAAATAASTGIDQLLSGLVAGALARRPPKAPFLIFWSALAGAIHLTVTGPGGRQQGTWLLDAPGHRGAGRGAVPRHATPWAVWDGHRLVRAHVPPGYGTAAARFCVDVGAYPGPLVGALEPGRWEALRQAPGAEPEYHALPPTESERVPGPRGEVEVLHAWWAPGRP